MLAHHRTIRWLRLMMAFASFSMPSKVALAGQTAHTTQAARSIDPAALMIPPDAGHVVSIHRPSSSLPGQPAKIIVHIQDAHANYGAQKHLAAMVDALARTYGIQLVLVEGSDGEASVSYLRAYAPLEQRTTIADDFLRQGKMSGEEYLDIIADYPLQLWGIDSDRYYDENVRIFVETEPARERLQPVVKNLEASVRQAAARVYPRALQELNASSAAYEEGTLAFDEYLARLQPWLASTGLSLAVYPALSGFVEAQALEQRINMTEVQSEQTRLLKSLQGQASQQDVAALMRLGRDMQERAGPSLAFYAALEQLSAAHGVRFATFTHLATYVQHLKLTQQIQTTDLSDELDRLTQQLRQVMVSDPDVVRLAAVESDLVMLRRLLELELTPNEYLAFAGQLEKVSLADRWLPVLRRYHIQPPSNALLQELQRAVPQVAQFYTVARQRNYAMVEKTLAKMDATKAQAAVLIAGGFHTPNLVRMLTQRGATVIVVAPTVAEATDEQLYHRVLRTQQKAPPPTDAELHPAFLAAKER